MNIFVKLKKNRYCLVIHALYKYIFKTPIVRALGN